MAINPFVALAIGSTLISGAQSYKAGARARYQSRKESARQLAAGKFEAESIKLQGIQEANILLEEYEEALAYNNAAVGLTGRDLSDRSLVAMKKRFAEKTAKELATITTQSDLAAKGAILKAEISAQAKRAQGSALYRQGIASMTQSLLKAGSQSENLIS